MSRSNRHFSLEITAILSLLLGACRGECPAFPASGGPPSTLALAECQVLARAFPALLEQHPHGNVVFSPHAATLALVQLASRAQGADRQRIVSLFGPGVALETLTGELAHAEERLKGPPLPDWPEVSEEQPLHFDYESVLTFPGAEQRVATRHAFAKRAVDRAHDGGHSLALVDATIAGVPWGAAARAESGTFAGAPASFLHVSRGPSFGCTSDFESAAWPAEHLQNDGIPPRNPQGRAYISFARPKRPSVSVSALPALPCTGGALAPEAASIELDFRAPAFCATSEVELKPALGITGLAGTATRVASRLGFDVRGTFNHPPHSLPSPQAEHDVQRGSRAGELSLDAPFFVTVHDRETGSIMYVAWIREAGVAASCQ